MKRYSPQTSLSLWKRRLAYRERRLARHRKRGNKRHVAKWERLVGEARRMVTRREHQATSLGDRAYKVARGLIGVMEEGGNNRGRMVSKIIRSNGGSGPEPWCGDFVAYCYRNAGSKSVRREWAAVRLLYPLVGIKQTGQPRKGDLVRFTFDHVGMFVKDLGNGRIETIEGNTGASGAVSDSKTGGDGVYRKVRPKSQVKDYLRVTR